ncbi:hypothetical protein G7054_g33 [Neopestalotiopsis clavispora]|nr:hypothetical protein G7054_g33 [Neopestalotiopsis clavispora]
MVSGTSLPICRRFLFSRGRPCNLTLIIAVIVLIWVFGFISVPRREEHAISVAIPATGPVTVFGTTITTTPPSAPVALPDFEAPLHVRTEDVYNTTLGFEKVFVLGLPARTDRRDAIVLSSVLSDFEIEFIDGIRGGMVPDKVLPLSPNGRPRPSNPEVGSNLTSALILEDDADWDVRLRVQMHNFAKSAQALLQPMHMTNIYVDPGFKHGSKHTRYRKEISLKRLPWTQQPSQTPYGDNWDVLWLGHCEMRLPTKEMDIPQALVADYPDLTVPEKKYLKFLSQPSDLEEEFFDHTRVVHRVQGGACSTAYALSRRGARSLLHDAGLKQFDEPFDIMLRTFCEGTGGRKRHVCLTSSPGLFEQHRSAGPKRKNSDITDHGDGIEEHAHTDNIRVSMRLNADSFMSMQPMTDQYPDERKPLDEKEYEGFKHKHMEIYPELIPETLPNDR